MGILITLLCLWLLWKFFKLSFQVIWWLFVIALVAIFVKMLLFPALILIGCIVGWNVLRS